VEVVRVACSCVVIVMSAVLVSSSARAQAPGQTPSTTPETAALPHPDAKSPNIAVALSLTPALLGLGMSAAGLYVANLAPDCGDDPNGPTQRCTDYFEPGMTLMLVGGGLLAVGPSFGHMYNRRAWTKGVKLRLLGVGISLVGLGIIAVTPRCGDFVCPGDGIGAIVMLGGAGTFVVGAGVDVINADSAVEQRNVELSVSRLRTPSGSAPALVLDVTF
jgi:hypothetical protein